MKHSFTFTPDAARSLVLLADTEDAWNQTWHVPTAPEPPTGKEFIKLAANEFGMQPKYRVITRPMHWVAGWFDTATRELYEMLYGYEFDYIFDSTKFIKAIHFQPASYPEGVHRTTHVRVGNSARKRDSDCMGSIVRGELTQNVFHVHPDRFIGYR